jgi:predicted nucleic acid-binding protein
MTSFMPDSNCMVAALSIWHDGNVRAVAAIEGRLRRGDDMVIAAHALAETYSVLTRLPRPRRASPQEALTAIERNFIANRTVVALDSDAYLALLRRAPSEGISGGRIYDAVIAACARAANVDTVLTFNERHFRQFAGAGLTIAVP